MKRSILTILFISNIVVFGQNVEEPIKSTGTEMIREEERRAGRGDSIYFPNSRRSVKTISKESKALLTPSEKDSEEYREFLKLSKTAIAKIFPDLKCSSSVLDVSDEKCLRAAQMPGQGAYYSFRKKNNYDVPRFDIYFADGRFSTIDSLQTFGFLVDLGDIPIESLDKNSPQIAGLKNYRLPKTQEELISKKENLNEGFTFENQLFTSKIKSKLNTTYGLRLANWTNRYIGGEDLDLLIVLRVIRENEDGSITFIWRELQKKTTPKLGKR